MSEPRPTPDEWRRFLAALPRRVAASGLLITDPDDRVLLVNPTYKPLWEIPGGVVEAGETPRAAAAREGREELGLDLPVGRLLAVEHQVTPSPRGDAVKFLYDGGTLSADAPIVVPPAELSEYRFVPVDSVDEFLGRRRSARVRAGLQARRDGLVVELSDGVVLG